MTANFVNFMDLRGEQLAVLGGRPAMGKTSLALSIAFEFISNGKPVVYYTNEMSESQIRLRMLQIMSQVSHVKSYEMDGVDAHGNRCYKGCSPFEINRLIESKSILESLKFDVCTDWNILSAPENGLLIVDYIQLFVDGDNASDKSLKIEKALKELKELAIDANAAVLALSQLNRGTEDRVGHRPILTDYKDSASLQEVPDKCFFFFRREYYDPHDKPGFGEIILAKSRFESPFTFPVKFIKDIGKVTPVNSDEYFEFRLE